MHIYSPETFITQINNNQRFRLDSKKNLTTSSKFDRFCDAITRVFCCRTTEHVKRQNHKLKKAMLAVLTDNSMSYNSIKPHPSLKGVTNSNQMAYKILALVMEERMKQCKTATEALLAGCSSPAAKNVSLIRGRYVRDVSGDAGASGGNNAPTVEVKADVHPSGKGKPVPAPRRRPSSRNDQADGAGQTEQTQGPLPGGPAGGKKTPPPKPPRPAFMQSGGPAGAKKTPPAVLPKPAFVQAGGPAGGKKTPPPKPPKPNFVQPGGGWPRPGDWPRPVARPAAGARQQPGGPGENEPRTPGTSNNPFFSGPRTPSPSRNNPFFPESPRQESGRRNVEARKSFLTGQKKIR